MKQKKYIIAGAVIASSLLLISVLSVFLSLDFYDSVEDFVNRQGELAGRIVRIKGVVEPDSVERDDQSLRISFTLTEGHASIRVAYTGVLPGNFEPGRDIVAQGSYDPVEGLFSANKLMFVCPSKYESVR